jgi:hypothetical protein
MKTGKLGFGLLLAVIVVFGVVHEISQPARAPRVLTPEEQARKDKSDEQGARVMAGGKAIRAAANNPESVKFRSVSVFENGTVCYEFTGSNAFGGIVQNYAVMPAHSTHITFNKAGVWNAQCKGVGGIQSGYLWELN